MANRKAWSQPQSGRGEARNIKEIGAVVAITAADVGTNNNTVEAFIIPAGFVPTGIKVVSTDLDTGTPALLMTIGDAGDDDRLLASSNIGQAGGTSTTLATVGYHYVYPVDTVCVIKFPTAAATGAAGTIDVALQGYIL